MRPGLEKFAPLVPVLAGYGLMIALGASLPGQWQLFAGLAFYCALGQAFDLFMGMTGYVNFGYVAFLGVGAYGMAVTIDGLAGSGLGGWLLVIGLLVAAAFAVLVALAVGAVALRLRGAYFAIATIGVSEGIRYLIEGARIWNGSAGIIFYRDMKDEFGRAATGAISNVWANVIVYGVGAAAAVLAVVWLRSRIGYALMALREDEDAARVMGIDVTRVKVTAFVASAALAGLLGAAAWALKPMSVYPAETFQIHYTVEAIIIVLLGGTGTVAGPLVGGVLYGGTKYALAVTKSLQGFHLLLFAPAIIVVILLFPEGLVGMARRKLRGTRFALWLGGGS